MFWIPYAREKLWKSRAKWTNEWFFHICWNSMWSFITKAINTSNELQQNKELNKLGIITCLSEEVFHHIRWKLNWNYSTIDLVEIQYSVTIDDMSDFNYQPNLSEFKRILNQWIQRKLSSINEFKENSPQLT